MKLTYRWTSLALVMIAACGQIANTHEDAGPAAGSDAGSSSPPGDSAPPMPMTRTVTVRPGGGGHGTVSSAVGSIACGSACAATLPVGTIVDLIAAADANATFMGWSGPCTGTASICTLTVSADTTVGAVFELRAREISVAVNGTGSGRVQGPSVDCPGDCSGFVVDGTSVTLTASAAGDSVFLGWSGVGCLGTGPCTFTAGADVTILASFGRNRSLIVTKTGAGAGTVTSSPGGILCGTDCSEEYVAGTVVSLTATPASQAQFAGWTGGGCSGTGPCAVTVNAAVLVDARFDRTCGRVGQQCCVTGPTCNDGSGCLSGTCTTCPTLPLTTHRAPLSLSTGTDCNGINIVQIFPAACSPGTHYDQCAATDTNSPLPDGTSCTVVGFSVPSDPSNCSCDVRMITPHDCFKHVTCEVDVTETKPHPDGCPL